ncbi:MAG: hypothetical protein JO218_19275 [Burkholderiales bacterium]|nr:hypothetical protein [Burkholderiales bacterium]
MKRVIRLSLLAAATAMLPACATLPGISMLDGSRQYDRTDYHLERVWVTEIDGSSSVDRNPVRVDPGDHTLMVQAHAVAGFHEPPVMTVKFHVEPCKTYYLAARRENRLSQQFELVTQEVEPLAGCTMPK